ncbi:MAG: hypothetical protein ABI352_05370 [Candidatus Dormibacter sp.]
MATHADRRAQAQAQVAVAHAAATTAFNAAALLDCWPAPAGGAPGTPFPEFWRDLIDRLAAAIRGCEAGADAEDRPLLEAACVARDAAQAGGRPQLLERDSVRTRRAGRAGGSCASQRLWPRTPDAPPSCPSANPPTDRAMTRSV